MTAGAPGADLAAATGFVVFGLVALVSALGVVTRRGPVAAVAWLVVHFISTAALYVLLRSQFIAAVQVLVYAGAVMVLFLFVIMLLSVDREVEPRPLAGPGRKVVVGLVLLALAVLLAWVAGAPGAVPTRATGEGAADVDTVERLAGDLFSTHLVAFEASSLVLLAAMAAVMVFTTRREPAGTEPPP